MTSADVVIICPDYWVPNSFHWLFFLISLQASFHKNIPGNKMNNNLSKREGNKFALLNWQIILNSDVKYGRFEGPPKKTLVCTNWWIQMYRNKWNAIPRIQRTLQNVPQPRFTEQNTWLKKFDKVGKKKSPVFFVGAHHSTLIRVKLP